MASSSRVLGKGRVLGAAPKPAPSSTQHAQRAQHARTTSLLSPSESSTSLNSQLSDSKLSSDTTPPDLSTAAALQAKDNAAAAAAAASSQLVCPICNEEMVTLLQLNRHLDDIHQHLEEVEQDEVKTWFKSQMIKAKKFQPLAVLNQKLKSLDMFETDNAANTPPLTANSISTSTSMPSAAGDSPARHASPSPAPPPRPAIDPDEAVTRQHWQRFAPDNLCSDPMCGKRLGGPNGSINCRHCGKLFCAEHTMYQMKLSRSAEHDPVRGYWSRVCETCYKSRQGYNDRTGVERDHTKEFAKTRRKAVDKAHLDISRLEKRLTRLTQLLADPRLEQEPGALGYLRSFSGSYNQKRAAEQSVVEWEDDTKVTHCPFCQQEFSSYSFRRHHCRLCGRVVCADPNTGCSEELGLNVDAPSEDSSEKTAAVRAVDIRMCKECKHTLFSKADFASELSAIPPDLRAYQHLQQFEKGIRLMLPKFQRLLTALQDPDHVPSASQIAEATKVRKRLTDSFTQYDVAARRIRDLPTTSPTQAQLQKAVYLQASGFLHLHMLPLKSLPRLLKHASPYGHASSPGPHGSSSHSRNNSSARFSTSPNGHLTPQRHQRHGSTTLLDSASASPSLSPAYPPFGATNSSDAGESSTAGASTLGLNDTTNNTTATTTPSFPGSNMARQTQGREGESEKDKETEQAALRDQLVVLEEQRGLVSDMLAAANRRRKFDEVASLAGNVRELEDLIEDVRGKLGLG